MKVSVRVPATTANLGPGFDSFGLALGLYNTVTVSNEGEGLTITGCDPVYANEKNLVYVAYKAAMDAMGLPVGAVTIHIAGDIPISRGLGSSAALLAAGAAGANALHGSPLSPQRLLEVTNPIEGHPDNLAPAIFGGLTASIMDGDKPLSVQFPLHPHWRFLALVPDFPLSTAAARSVLPKQYSRADAVFNPGRGALVMKALELGDMGLLRAALDDRIHQPYRRKLIGDYDVIEALVRAEGGAFCLSGAGPTLLCITMDEGLGARLREKLTGPTDALWTVSELRAEHDGVAVEILD